MTNFPSAYSTCRFCFTCGKRRKIIMEGKFFSSLIQNVIYDLLIKLGPESNCCKRLCFPPCEKGRTMGGRKRIYFTNDLPDLIRFSSVKTNIIIKDEPSGCLLKNLVVLSLYQSLIDRIFFSVLCQKFRDY
jgi:hypothetical protein